MLVLIIVVCVLIKLTNLVIKLRDIKMNTFLVWIGIKSVCFLKLFSYIKLVL